MILRDLAANWGRANCPDIEVQADFLDRLDGALQQGKGCSFVVGRDLTKSHSAFLVCCYCGELFVFQLSASQMAALDAADNELVSARGFNEQNHVAHSDPPVHLGKIVVDGLGSIDPRSPITGVISCTADRLWALPLAVRAVCEPPARTSVVFHHYLHGLSKGANEIRFSLASLEGLWDSTTEPVVRLLPIFFQLGVVGEPESEPLHGAVGSHLRPPSIPKLASSAPPVQPKQSGLGEMLDLRAPLPAVVTADTLRHTLANVSEPEASHPGLPRSVGSGQIHFRAISDVRAALVEIE